jgi:mortality factor 4-like protein 1
LPAPAPKKKGAAALEGKKGASASGVESTSKGVKRARDHDLEKVSVLSLNAILKDSPQQSEFLNRPEIKLAIPDTLKSVLVDDWENITKHQQVPKPFLSFLLFLTI